MLLEFLALNSPPLDFSRETVIIIIIIIMIGMTNNNSSNIIIRLK